MANAASATVFLLANDAMEASRESAVHAALLLMDAALSIMVTSHKSASARREMIGMLTQRSIRQVEELIAGEKAQ